MNIVLLASEASQADAAFREETGAVLIGWAGSSADIGLVRPPSWMRRLQARFESAFLARAFLRMLGVDNATQFARRITRDTAAAAALSGAGMVVALDESAAYAAWRCAHRTSADVQAYYGRAAARDAIAKGEGL